MTARTVKITTMRARKEEFEAAIVECLSFFFFTSVRLGFLRFFMRENYREQYCADEVKCLWWGCGYIDREGERESEGDSGRAGSCPCAQAGMKVEQTAGSF